MQICKIICLRVISRLIRLRVNPFLGSVLGKHFVLYCLFDHCPHELRFGARNYFASVDESVITGQLHRIKIIPCVRYNFIALTVSLGAQLLIINQVRNLRQTLKAELLDECYDRICFKRGHLATCLSRQRYTTHTVV